MPKYFCVYIKRKDGKGGYLSHRDRTAWTLRTARKHLADVVREKATMNKWQDVEYFAIVAD